VVTRPSGPDGPDLVRRAVVTDVLYRYCRGVDRKDWDTVRGCFHPDAVDTHGAVDGTVEDLIQWTASKHERVPQSMHMLTNIGFLAESATTVVTETYCSVRQRIERGGDRPAAHLAVGCRYLDRFEHRGGEWRIAHRTVVYEWVDHLAVERDLLATDPSLPRSRRDREDPSYLLHAEVVT
jgi:hypothetical protein